MTLTLPKTCAMGSSKTGLVGTIGLTLLNPDGTTHTARATAGIYEIGGGAYGREVAFPDNWSGSLKWDTGGGSPKYAVEDYDALGLLDMIEEDTSKMNFIGTDIKATLDSEEVITDAASRTASKADVSNLDVAVSTRSAHSDPTTAIKGIPGKTNQEVFDNEKGTDGAYTGTPPTVDEIRTELEQTGAKISDIKTQTDKIQFTVTNDIKATLDGEEVTLNATTEAQLNTIEEEVKRTLGLVHENIYIDLPGYDTNKNLVSARLRTYSVPGSVGTASDVIAAYTITAVGAGKGKFTSWKMVKQ